MITIKSFVILLTLPVKLFWVIIKYPFVGGINNKFKNNLVDSLKITVFREAMSYPIEDKGKLSFITNEFVINSIIKKLYPKLTNLNNYGKRYDQNSFWIVEAEGSTGDDPVILYSHGGGFVFESAPSQIEGLLTSYYLLEPQNREKLSILFLDYNLVSKGYKLPHQLNQLTETYTNLINQGRKNIILFGDSAGGTLSITLLQKLKNDESLSSLPFPRSSILISPWCKLVPQEEDYSSDHSIYDNSVKDMLQTHHFRQMFSTKESEFMFGDNDYKSLTISPGNCPYKYSDWQSIPTLNDPGYSTFVILGEDETLRDDILEWSKFAVRSPLNPPKECSNGVWDSEIHEYIKDSEDSAYVEVIIEPFGVHDAFFMFENGILSEINKNPNLKVEDLDKEKYFGTVKVIEFLSKVIKESESKKTI